MIDTHGSVLEMRQLRDAHGAGKLGINVVANISEALAHRGLSHYPHPLPVNQWEKARIFRNGTPVARLIGAAFQVDEAADEVLRTFASSSANEADETLRRIRELVCD